MLDAVERGRVAHRIIRMREGGLGNLSLSDIVSTAQSLPNSNPSSGEGVSQFIGGSDVHPLAEVMRSLASVEDAVAVEEMMSLSDEELHREWRSTTLEANNEIDKAGFRKALKSQEKDLDQAADASAKMAETGEWDKGY